MGSTGEKLVYLEQTKKLIAAAIEEQGVEVSEEDTFRAYAALIATIGKLPDLTEEDEGKILQVIGGAWGIGAGLSTDATFKTAGAAADAKATGDRLLLIERNIADILYKAISVTSFSTNVPVAEIGSTVNDVTLYWMLNKTPVSVTIDSAAQDAVAEGEVALTSLGLTADKTWTIRATDERGAVATKSASLSFLNGVYCGAAAMPAALDSAFILTLQRGLRSGKVTSFTANADAGEYLWYVLPKRYGTCTFAVGGFTGGFTLLTTMPFTNASGYTEDYYVYKSDNAGLGRTSVTVS